MGAKGKVGYKCRIAAVLLLFLASVGGLIAVTLIQDLLSSKEYSTEYGIVIDAGSSRSTVYLYEWPGEKENETGVVTEVKKCRVAGNGISEMKVNPEKDDKSWQAFKVCMDGISEAIPAAKHKTTTLFLGATAGMRLLDEEDKQRSNEIMASLTDYLRSLPFDFQDASIITGQEEGLYGWITVNYIMGNFLEKNLWNTYVRPLGADTVGSMDLGGASTQIAFAVPDDLRGEDYLQLKLYGYPYNVYTHSFLCYGKNEAEKRVLDKIIQAAPDPAYILSPCHPEGFNITVNVSSIYDTECTKKPRNFDPNQMVFLVGDPNSNKCGDIVRSIFDFKSCSSGSCSFDGVEQPPVTGDFMAYAGFFYTARALGVNDTSELEDFSALLQKFCHTHWTALRTEKQWISDRYLKGYCYSAHYIFTLLTEGYKFDKESFNHISFQEKVKDTSVGWSLGYMLSSSNMIPSEVKTVFPMTNPLFAGLVFLFSALTIIAVVIGFIILIRMCY